MTTQTDPNDKALIDEDNKRKTDLEQGADGVLDDGKSPVPIKSDPFEGRKSLYKASKGRRAARVEAEAAANPDVQRDIDAMAAESGEQGNRNELDRGSHVDTNAPDRFERERMLARGQNPDQRLNDDDKAAASNAPVSSSSRVKVTVLGQELEVPQSDIDEAGGVVAYQKDRAASMRLQAAAKEAAKLKADREALEAERNEFNQQRDSAGRNAPAKAPGGTPGAAPTQTGGAGDSADVQAKAEAIANDLYSGDPKRARAAIAQIMQGQSAPAAQIDPAEVARQAAELLKQQDEGKSEPAKQPVDVAQQVEIDELNSMMAAKFRDVLDDPDLKAKALAKFNELKALPENRYRRLVDLGREAAKTVQNEGPHPRKEVVERKQSLPPLPSGTQAHREQEVAPLSGSGHIARMRQARGLPS